jgi:VanZ family protein
MKDIKIVKFMPGIAWFFVVLVLLCMPGKDVPSIGWMDKIYFDKWVHCGIFGLLALLFMLPFALSKLDHKEKLHSFIRIAMATALWGITSEFIQKYWIPGRSFDLLDWAADSFGALVALIFCKVKFLAASKTA